MQSKNLHLSKGDSIELTTVVPRITALIVGLSWDVPTTADSDFDLDASAIAVNARGKVYSDEHFVFFNNLQTSDNSISHTGNNAMKGGDNEAILINLAALPADIKRIVFPVSIYDAEDRGQNFGQVRTTCVRIVNQADGQEIVRYDFSRDTASETAVICGELYRVGSKWGFRAIGQGYDSGLVGIAEEFGVNI
ncbi:TerD family protein [Streptomyces mirabilis]|uniref:TerD family protein n=1 Tax=Streptomyces mirabilis TaxID=68239 RepID=UPI00369F5C9B